MKAIIEERMTDELRRRLERLQEDVADPSERLTRRLALTQSVYLFDPVEMNAVGEGDVPPDADIPGPFDSRAHTETWNDMLRLQEEGVYPAAFSAIKSPVVMLHGAYDPHPGWMIRASLLPHLPQLEYREWERCGHSPWLEKAVRDEFFAVLRDWLTRRILAGGHPEE
jgi:pimeloyl-ACP methyl ester carboxylesterase